jgi:hypothetical protein
MITGIVSAHDVLDRPQRLGFQYILDVGTRDTWAHEGFSRASFNNVMRQLSFTRRTRQLEEHGALAVSMSAGPSACASSIRTQKTRVCRGRFGGGVVAFGLLDGESPGGRSAPSWPSVFPHGP